MSHGGSSLREEQSRLDIPQFYYVELLPSLKQGHMLVVRIRLLSLREQILYIAQIH